MARATGQVGEVTPVTCPTPPTPAPMPTSCISFLTQCACGEGGCKRVCDIGGDDRRGRYILGGQNARWPASRSIQRAVRSGGLSPEKDCPARPPPPPRHRSRSGRQHWCKSAGHGQAEWPKLWSTRPKPEPSVLKRGCRPLGGHGGPRCWRWRRVGGLRVLV